MTISLTVILIESTGNISFALPLIITLISAKWVGDYFNEGIYDIQIAVSKVPMLPWVVDPSLRWKTASQIMKENPVSIRVQESVSFIVDLLKNNQHNGFPVVDDAFDDVSRFDHCFFKRFTSLNIFHPLFRLSIHRVDCAVSFCDHN